MFCCSSPPPPHFLVSRTRVKCKCQVVQWCRVQDAADANHVSALSRLRNLQSAACSRQGEQVNIVSSEHHCPPAPRT